MGERAREDSDEWRHDDDQRDSGDDRLERVHRFEYGRTPTRPKQTRQEAMDCEQNTLHINTCPAFLRTPAHTSTHSRVYFHGSRLRPSKFIVTLCKVTRRRGDVHPSLAWTSPSRGSSSLNQKRKQGEVPRLWRKGIADQRTHDLFRRSPEVCQM